MYPRRIPAGKSKNGDAPKEDKKPFEDRVLNKALEYLRGELKRAEVRPAAPPEIRNG